MLAILMFIMGIVLLNRGKANIPFLKIDAQGSAVRSAGVILMLPLGTDLVLSTYIAMTTGGNLDDMLRAVEQIALIQWVVVISCAAWAYVTLRRAEPISTSDAGVDGEPKPQKEQREQRAHPLSGFPTLTTAPKQLQPSQGVASTSQATFPRVMTLAEAARYLNVTEQQILEAINQGKIPAARNNGIYSIARIVLDEYREASQGFASAV
jgi:excisionase family DNA binding protein